jgi:hypothetical protein
MVTRRPPLWRLPDRNEVAETTRKPVIGEGSPMNRMSACETHLVREEDLRDRVLIARVRIIDVRFGLLQLCLA